MRNPQLCSSAKPHTLSWQVKFFFCFIQLYHLLQYLLTQCEGTHRTALVIEDAETLGTLLSKVENRAQVSQLMMTYDDIRHPRCARMYKHHWFLDTIYKYPIGPQQESRDRVLRRTLVHEDWDVLEPSGFQAMLGDHLTSFAYDATEAVEDWRASRVATNKPFWRSPVDRKSVV